MYTLVIPTFISLYILYKEQTKQTRFLQARSRFANKLGLYVRAYFSYNPSRLNYLVNLLLIISNHRLLSFVLNNVQFIIQIIFLIYQLIFLFTLMIFTSSKSSSCY